MIHKVDDCVRRSRNLRSRLIVAIIYDIITRKYIIIILVHRHHMSLCSRVLGSKRQLVAISRYIQVHKMVVFITGSRGIRTIIRNAVPHGKDTVHEMVTQEVQQVKRLCFFLGVSVIIDCIRNRDDDQQPDKKADRS